MTNAQNSHPRGQLHKVRRELLRELGDFLRRSIPGRCGFALTVILVVVALAAPWLAPYDPVAQNLPARLLSPTFLESETQIDFCRQCVLNVADASR